MKLLVPLMISASLFATAAARADESSPADAGAQSAALVTGLWTFGAGAQPEPQERTVTLPLNCYGGGPQMELTRDRDAIQVEIHTYPPTTGAMPPSVVEEDEVLRGTLRGKVLVLTGEHVTRESSNLYPYSKKESRQAVRYELQLNARGHLVGTLQQGKSAPVQFWAAPAVRATGRCGPPPP